MNCCKTCGIKIHEVYTESGDPVTEWVSTWTGEPGCTEFGGHDPEF